MKRELGLRDADLHVAYVLNTHTVRAVIQENVRIKTGVRTENVHWNGELDIVIK